VEEDQVKEYFSKLYIQNSLGPDGVLSQLLRQLAVVVARPLSVIFDHSNWENCLKTGEKQMSPLSSRRRSMGTTDWSTSL